VEDEVAVRRGLVLLLQAWGARAHALATMAATQAWLQTAAAERPDLLIVDYRLPRARRAGCRAKHWQGQHIPAIPDTGSGLDGHEDESEVHDFQLLIKAGAAERVAGDDWVQLGGEVGGGSKPLTGKGWACPCTARVRGLSSCPRRRFGRGDNNDPTCCRQPRYSFRR
jgi:CheY-like chemotaxis protein